jgi:hypothetical protein
MIVPDKTIAYYPVSSLKDTDVDISKFLRPLNLDHKREWFSPHFYKCLPLSIGNMQGFAFSVPFDFEVHWHGGISTDSVHVITNFDEKEKPLVKIASEFGHGIFTVHFPLILKTPPGINLMTISPPNFPTPGISPMTGVVETDNLKFTFTLNFKIDYQDMPIKIAANTPIMGIIPVPRYFCDSFELKKAEEIFDKSIIEEEQSIEEEQAISRQNQNQYAYDPENHYADGRYYRGEDIRGNKFPDHQLPRKKKQ